ncbi:MAG: hypothetical protein NC308_09145 [Clostridium sp.]|nr:DUF5009 domain-containing protein [Bacteroides sp.]MCM1199041.1 hypothetical protein [Clostridium sp.]
MEKKTRLASLDVLRGLDLFLLLAIGPVLHTLVWTSDGAAIDIIRGQVEHAAWHGFVLWDIIMPLFMFMSGVTIPFSMERYKSGIRPDKTFYLRLLKRFAMLFFLGWIVQGNLLAFDWKAFHPFANTLQAIAVGYVFSALIYVLLDRKWQIMAVLVLFIAYIVAFIASGMDLDPQSNIAMAVDKAVLGSHRDGVVWLPDGSWSYDLSYQYTWILSSLNFIVTVMLGCFAGQIMKNGEDGMATSRKAAMLLVTGILLVAAGLLMDPFFPIIKKIWSSSMTLFSGGICFLLMAAVYYAVDVKGRSRGLDWARYYGMNSIAAYFIGEVIVFTSVSASFLHGMEQWLGEYYPVLLSAANVTILFLILRRMYKSGIFLKI